MKNIQMGNEGKKFDTQAYPSDNIGYFEKSYKKCPMLSESTPISSMGSCFATNIAKYLASKNYNYLMMPWDDIKINPSSVNGGYVYNPVCMSQIYQYSFEDFDPIVRWWYRDNQAIDPFRRNISYKITDKNELFRIHKKQSYNILKSTDIMVLTLGMSEVWRDKRDKSTFGRTPPKELYDSDIHEFSILTVDECVKSLENIKRIINLYNPNCKLILTVSPVPLFATFRKDVDPVSANMTSKSILKSAADYFIRNTKNTYYFPSYEFVMSSKDAYKKDNRHIKDNIINSVMGLFEKMFI